MSDPIYHYTLAADYERSKAAGEHRISGRRMTLADEGFIHFCSAQQRAGVWQRYWSGVAEPVVLLTVDPHRTGPVVVWENTSGGSELFPHLYGPLPIDAVISTQPIGPDGEPERPTEW